jgi:hypothetical protein
MWRLPMASVRLDLPVQQGQRLQTNARGASSHLIVARFNVHRAALACTAAALG